MSGVIGEKTDQRAGKGGLAGAEIARQRDEVAGFQRIGNVCRKAVCRLLVVERDGKLVSRERVVVAAMVVKAGMPVRSK